MDAECFWIQIAEHIEPLIPSKGTMTIAKIIRLIALILITSAPVGLTAEGLRKGQDIVIYDDPTFYSAFPSIVHRPNGELIVAFRRAPERRSFAETGITHTDPNSYLVLVRSRDGGKTWGSDPELIFAHPFGGSQDPCLLQLRDGSLLCSSYGWARLEMDAIAKLKQPVANYGNFVFLGGYILKSRDGGKSWQPPIFPPANPTELNLDIFGKTVAAYNRGAMCQGKDGRVHFAVAASATNNSKHTEVHLMSSVDNGQTWKYSCPIASDTKIQFNETSLFETPNRDLVAFVRTEGFNDHTVIARSTDQGKSFQWQDAGFRGHPHYALQLPDRRVLLVYGYRHKPYGIRARVLDSECRDFKNSEEIILRDDGGNGDLGYPWATLVSKKQALIVYYFNKNDGTRQIAGTFLDLN